MQNTSFFSVSVVVLAAAGALIGALVSYPVYSWFTAFEEAPMQNSYGYAPEGWCNVLAVQLHGTIVATRSEVPVTDLIQQGLSDGSTMLAAPNYAIANDITDTLAIAKNDPSIQAVLVDIDSPGGGPTASQEISEALDNMDKPVVGVIHEIGTSGGYWVGTAAHPLFAYPTSMVGSIGVTSSYLSNAEKNRKEGLIYNQLSSGKYKDMLSPDKALTDEERALVMKELNELHDIFVTRVATSRNIPEDAVRKLADGSAMNGTGALEHKLIDELGGLPSAKKYLEEKLGGPVALCWH